MKNKELQEKLSQLDPEADILVWEGYDAGCTTTDIEVSEGTYWDSKKPYIMIQGD